MNAIGLRRLVAGAQLITSFLTRPVTGVVLQPAETAAEAGAEAPPSAKRGKPSVAPAAVNASGAPPPPTEATQPIRLFNHVMWIRTQSANLWQVLNSTADAKVKCKLPLGSVHMAVEPTVPGSDVGAKGPGTRPIMQMNASFVGADRARILAFVRDRVIPQICTLYNVHKPKHMIAGLYLHMPPPSACDAASAAAAADADCCSIEVELLVFNRPFELHMQDRLHTLMTAAFRADAMSATAEAKGFASVFEDNTRAFVEGTIKQMMHIRRINEETLKDALVAAASDSPTIPAPADVKEPAAAAAAAAAVTLRELTRDEVEVVLDTVAKRQRARDAEADETMFAQMLHVKAKAANMMTLYNRVSNALYLSMRLTLEWQRYLHASWEVVLENQKQQRARLDGPTGPALSLFAFPVIASSRFIRHVLVEEWPQLVDALGPASVQLSVGATDTMGEYDAGNSITASASVINVAPIYKATAAEEAALAASAAGSAKPTDDSETKRPGERSGRSRMRTRRVQVGAPLPLPKQTERAFDQSLGPSANMIVQRIAIGHAYEVSHPTKGQHPMHFVAYNVMPACTRERRDTAADLAVLRTELIVTHGGYSACLPTLEPRHFDLMWESCPLTLSDATSQFVRCTKICSATWAAARAKDRSAAKAAASPVAEAVAAPNPMAAAGAAAGTASSESGTAVAAAAAPPQAPPFDSRGDEDMGIQHPAVPSHLFKFHALF